MGRAARLTVPRSMSEIEVEQVLRGKRNWIEEQRRRQVPRLGLERLAVSESNARIEAREICPRRSPRRRAPAWASPIGASGSAGSARFGVPAHLAERSPSTGYWCWRPMRCSTMWSCTSSATCVSPTTHSASGGSSSSGGRSGASNETGCASTGLNCWPSKPLSDAHWIGSIAGLLRVGPVTRASNLVFSLGNGLVSGKSRPRRQLMRSA